MRVLGISPLDKDATASFMEDGRVVFACGEERLSRVKLQGGFPHRAVRLGLERTGWDPGSIDTVAYAFFDGAEESRLIHEAAQEDARRHRSDCTTASLARLRDVLAGGYRLDRTRRIPGLPEGKSEFMPPKAWYKRFVYDLIARHPWLDWRAHRHFFRNWVREATADHHRRTAQLAAGLAEYGLAGKLRRFHHHDTHAANCFYASGYEEALLVTLDGYGSGNCGAVYVGNRDGIQCLHLTAAPRNPPTTMRLTSPDLAGDRALTG